MWSLAALAAAAAGAACAQHRYPPQPQGYVPEGPAPWYTVPTGQAVAIQIVKTIGTGETKAGNRFAIRLAAPLIAYGQIVLPEGTTGEGRVIQSSGPGIGGKGAKLVVSADFLTLKGGQLPLQGLQLTGAGKDHTTAADLVSMAGWISAPLQFAGFIVTGGDIEIPAGVNAVAKVARAVNLVPVRAATAQDVAQVLKVFGDRAYGDPEPGHGKIDVPPPPPGLGQVVFYRDRTAAGAGFWFNVREKGEALGKLTNGAWFAAPMTPGLHEFSATTEPQFTDHLTLKVDPGETYYVEGLMTHGVVMGVADLTPSAKAQFDEVSARLSKAPASRPQAEAQRQPPRG